MRASLNWLKEFVHCKERLPAIQESLTMTGLEVKETVAIEGDTVMDIEVTPNRPDCLSVLGIARELAAALGKGLRTPASVEKYYNKKGSQRGRVKIEILDRKACPRYVGCVIKNVKVGPSPAWLVERLNAMGLRSVNNIVDITNYVLFELGQPLHAFDLEKLRGDKIVVRRAKKGEEIVTIDGMKRELEHDILVIADEERPVAIAGIMGGKETEISQDTTNVLLESAYFNPILIRKAQRKLSLASESSYRFERGVDFGMVYAASVRAQEMIKKYGGKNVKPTKAVDNGGALIHEKKITLREAEIERVLGVRISGAETARLFKRLGLSALKKKEGIIEVRVPPFRQDLDAEVDLIEEIARLYGYDTIPSKCPCFKALGTIPEERKEEEAVSAHIKRGLTSLGLNEIVTYTLTSRMGIEAVGKGFEGAVKLRNPLSANQEFMRRSLLPNMLEALAWNINRKNPCEKLFELSRVYILSTDGRGVLEKKRLSVGLAGRTHGDWKEKSRELDFFDLKGVIESLLDYTGIKDYVIEEAESELFNLPMSASIKKGAVVMGMLGEVREGIARRFNIKQRVYMAELDFEAILKEARIDKRFMPLPKYPSVRRDISMLVDESMNAAEIETVIRENGKGLVRSIELFDIYKGQQVEPGKKSLAYTLEYRSDEKTLKDAEVNEVHRTIQAALIARGAQIR